MRRSGLWCRLADELGVVADVGPLAEQSPRTEGSDKPAGIFLSLLTRRAQQHVAVCARCRAERAEWAHIAGLLEDVERPVAPASVYAGLMAKIAGERAEQGARQQATELVAGVAPRGAERVGPRGITDAHRGVSNPAGSFADAEPGWLAPVLALVVGWSFVVATIGPLLGPLDRTLALARGAVGEVWGQLSHVVGSGLSLMPPTLEPVLVALGWGVFGWAVTVSVLVVTTKLSDVF